MREWTLKVPGAIYGLIASVRNHAYDKAWLESHGVRLPVISVGNVTAGGNAKTPLCVFIVEKLKQMGCAPVVLTRGYGGNEKGPALVTDISSAEMVGDEPVLLFKRGIKVVVSRKRVVGARFIEDHNVGDIIVLDDGFQHRQLQRDLDIITINAGSEVKPEKHFRMLPAGFLREPFSPALKRTDAVILSERRPAGKSSSVAEEIGKTIPSGVKLFRSFVKPGDILSLSSKEVLKTDEAVAFCGIANPEGFFSTLESCGVRLLARKTFADHHRYSKNDIQKIRGQHAQVPLVCTEKDAVKLPADSQEGVYYLRIETIVEPEADFEAMLKQVLQAR